MSVSEEKNTPAITNPLGISELERAIGEMGYAYWNYLNAYNDRQALENRLQNLYQDLKNKFAIYQNAAGRVRKMMEESQNPG